LVGENDVAMLYLQKNQKLSYLTLPSAYACMISSLKAS
jgi:hypothetical protein